MSMSSRGRVTFLLTDIEGSTRMLARLGGRYPELVAEHRAVIAQAAARHGGEATAVEGDGFLATFTTAGAAVRAAVEAQHSLSSLEAGTDSLRVRIGIHSGDAMILDGEHFGLDLHRAARIADAGHGGQILVSEATATEAADEFAPGMVLQDLGLHRLKDLDAPLRLYQLQAPGLASEFPPLRTLPPEAHNLPAQTTTLVGRRADVQAVARMVERHRLVTLTGPGGIGKTRLAIHVGARAVPAFPDGVWLVELTRTDDAAQVPLLVAAALGIDTAGCSQPQAVVAEAVRTKSLLLILDNLEHLMDAAADVSGLLAAAPEVHVLATSRERLLLAGEHTYEVPPLGVAGDAGDAPRPSTHAADAVALFVDRAQAHDRTFAPTSEDLDDIAAICRLVDGLPLAVELAAAQVRMLSVRSIRRRLEQERDSLVSDTRDLPERHRRLRDTIDWSYRLLPPEEQHLFGRLSVFRGGRTLDAVRAVCGPGLDIDVWDGLTALVDKSLVRRRITEGGDVAFEMLQTIHDFASDVLDNSDEADDVRRLHAQYLLELAERADAGMLTADAYAWERILTEQLANIRAALAWAFGQGGSGPGQRQEDAVTLGVRLTAALNLYWYWGGPHHDGRRWLGVAAEHADPRDAAVQGRLEVGLGFFGYADGDLQTGRHHWQRARDAFTAAGDDVRRCLAQSWIALTWAGEKDGQPRAEALIEKSLELARQVGGDGRLVADALTAKGEIARLGEDDATAEDCYAEALAIVDALGDENYVASLKANLAYLLSHRGDLEQARRFSLESLETSWKLGKRLATAWALGDLAVPEAALGHSERAARLLGASDEALARMGVSWQPADQPEHDRTLASLADTLGAESLEAVLAEGRSLSLDQAVGYALAAGDPGSG